MALALALSAPALYASGPPPGKPAAMDPKYSTGLYLTATGTGPSEERARNQAVAELSRIFESGIYSETTDRIKATLGPSGEKITQDIASRIRVVSEVRLQGVEIAASWFDEKKGLYYAVAALEKHQARDSWMREIRDLDMDIEGRLGALNSTGSRLIRLKSLYAVLELWVGREVALSRLRVLGFDDDVSGPLYDIKPVFGMIPELKAAMKIFIDITGEDGQKLKGKLSEALGRAGYVLTDSPDDAEVLIAGSMAVRPVEVRDPRWKYARATASLSVKDLKAGVTAGDLSDNKRAGHLNYPEAAHKASEKISMSISEALIGFLERAQ